MLHGRSRVVLLMINQEFWIISGHATVCVVVYSCIPCIKFHATIPHPFMADLPASRVVAYQPFSKMGIDYGDPFIIRENRRRRACTNKVY